MENKKIYVLIDNEYITFCKSYNDYVEGGFYEKLDKAYKAEHLFNIIANYEDMGYTLEYRREG